MCVVPQLKITMVPKERTTFLHLSFWKPCHEEQLPSDPLPLREVNHR